MDRIEIINNWNLSRVFQELEQGDLSHPAYSGLLKYIEENF